MSNGKSRGTSVKIEDLPHQPREHVEREQRAVTGGRKDGDGERQRPSPEGPAADGNLAADAKVCGRAFCGSN